MSSTFYFFTHKDAPVLLPGAPFILASIIMLASTIIAYTTLRKHRQNLQNKAEETRQSNQ
jgi:DHA1 family tetracycline resistance protein-like MFS transporter